MKNKSHTSAEGATWGEQGFQVSGVRQALERRWGDGSLCLSCLFIYTEQWAMGHPGVSCDVQMAPALSCSPQGLRNLAHLAQGLL